MKHEARMGGGKNRRGRGCRQTPVGVSVSACLYFKDAGGPLRPWRGKDQVGQKQSVLK